MEHGVPAGHLTTRNIVSAYRAALSRNVRRTRQIGVESELLEAHLDRGSPIAGKRLQDVQFPSETLVVSISRDGETLFPRGETCLEPGDHLLMLTSRQGEAALRSFLELQAPHEESVQP
jgi:Trk K+ transport system NAD-binding subunit